MPKKYMVELAQDERDELEAVLKSSTRRAVSATKLQRARILLAVDQGGTGPALTDMQVMDALGVTERTCQHVRRRAVEQGPMKALERRPRPLPLVPRKLDGEKEARLVQVACSVPPEGRVRWTVKMLAEELARLEVVESILRGDRAAGVKKNELKPWRREMWCIPKQQSHHFVAGMERVLKVYRRPYDPRHPVVCMDEMSKQLVAEVREKLPVRPGSPEKYDAHYLRRGACTTVWMFGEPLSGWRTVAVTKRRTTLDWAKQVRALANLPRYRDAKSITLVCDNLNTHSGDSFYAAFPAAEASRLNDRIHLVHTPKHGSWLNVAELEFSVLHRQCLDRRIESQWHSFSDHCHSFKEVPFTPVWNASPMLS